MAEAVVDLFEVVQIKHQHRQLARRALGPAQFRAEPLQPALPRGDARQLIDVAALAQLVDRVHRLQCFNEQRGDDRHRLADVRAQRPLRHIQREHAGDAVGDLERKRGPRRLAGKQGIASRCIVVTAGECLSPVAETGREPDAIDAEKRRQLFDDLLVDRFARTRALEIDCE